MPFVTTFLTNMPKRKLHIQIWYQLYALPINTKLIYFGLNYLLKNSNFLIILLAEGYSDNLFRRRVPGI